MRFILYLWVLFLTALFTAASIYLYFLPEKAPIFEPTFRSGVTILKTDFSNMSLAEAEAEIQNLLEQNYEVLVNTRVIRITPAELGIKSNKTALIELFYKCKTTQCLTEWQNNPSKLVEIDQSVYEKTKKELEDQLQLMLSRPALDFDNYSVTAFGAEGKVVIDDQLLSKSFIEAIFGKTGSLFLPTKVVYENGWEGQAEATQETINKVATSRLWLKIGRNQYWVNGDEVEILFNVRKDGDYTRAYLKKEAIADLINKYNAQNTFEVEIIPTAATTAVAHALLFRCGGEDPSYPIYIPLKGDYSSQIPLTGKYVEVNKSQQRAYIFEEGKLIRTVMVGTGLLTETPVGNFEILRHDPMAISYTGGWYMPYYQPLGTVEGGYFGFHEIPYQYNPQYGIVARDARTMGSPATHGCIQLTHEDAVWMFEWADIGTPVVIVE